MTEMHDRCGGWKTVKAAVPRFLYGEGGVWGEFGGWGGVWGVGVGWGVGGWGGGVGVGVGGWCRGVTVIRWVGRVGNSSVLRVGVVDTGSHFLFNSFSP